MKRTTAVAVGILALGCGGGGRSAPPAPAGVPAGAAPTASVDPATRNRSDAPEISRSAGVAGGVVVLWPRVTPRSSDARAHDIAASVQRRLASLVQKAAPGAPVDVRPEPERVCPRTGCVGAAIGAALFAKGPSCAVVALVSPAGTSPQRLVPWAGLVRVPQDALPFRDPPEPQIAVDDFAECDHVDASLAEHDADVVAALRAVVAAGTLHRADAP